MVINLMGENTPIVNQDIVADVKVELGYFKKFNKLILRRINTLKKNKNELKSDIEAIDACLEAFKLRE